MHARSQSARSCRVVCDIGPSWSTIGAACLRPATAVRQDVGMLDHVGIQCSDLDTSARFYDAVLKPLGFGRLMDFGVAIGYGKDEPDFWIGIFDSGEGF